MQEGDKVKILNNSQSQQYDTDRPVKPGSEGIITSRTAGGAWNVDLIDPVDGTKVNIWFKPYDLMKVDY
tara:strand:+ start:13515 stop:13721 length:207 start_codon:yes stop_codon:yes gene_type:complete